MSFEKPNPTAEQFSEEDKVRAEERNRYRKLSEKLLGRGKVTGMDIAIERAMKLDEETEKMIADGEAKTTLEALEKINEKEGLGLKGKELIGKEEYARTEALRIMKKVDEGKFEKARNILLGSDKIFSPDYGQDEVKNQLIGKNITPFIKEKVVEYIKNKKGG